MTPAAQGPRQGWARRGLRAGCALAQALQFCLGLGMAEGPQSPWEPALGTSVLLFVGRVEAAHAEGAEEAALQPRVALHQGLQAGELCWHVLGEEGPSLWSRAPESTPCTSPTPSPLLSHHAPAVWKAGG